MKELDGTKGYKLTNSRDVQETVIEKYLNFKLTENDFADKGKEAGKIAGEFGKLEAEFDGIKREWKEKLDTKETELSLILGTIRRGDEDRKVKCVEQKDFTKYVVNYIFEGEIMHTRPMEMHERQMELVTDIKSKVSKDNEKDVMQDQLVKGAAPVSQADRDLRDVMREETNKKTKKDLSSNGH